MQKIIKAKNPVLYVGGGVILSNANVELTELAHKLNLPVTMTLMGLGGFPGGDPLSMGMLGMHGSYAANMAVANSDLLIAVGARFDDRVTGRLDAFALTPPSFISTLIPPQSARTSRLISLSLPTVNMPFRPSTTGSTVPATSIAIR